MAEHRVRLTEDELSMISAALRARSAGVGRYTSRKMLQLAERLEEIGPGNPIWRFGDPNEPWQTAAARHRRKLAGLDEKS